MLVARNISALESLDDELAQYSCQTTLVPLDLKLYDRLESLGAALDEKGMSLDCVIGCAAQLGDLGPLAHQDPNTWHEVMAVNFQANFHLIRTLDPLLKKTKDPRAIFVTTGLTQKVTPYWGAYQVSKVALEGMVKLYALENKETSLKVNLVDPGVLATDLFHKAMPGVDLATIPKPESVTDVFVYLASRECQETNEIFKAKDFKGSLLQSFAQ